MSVTARALAIVTGHPTLKLVLLTVAASPGWPAAADVAVVAEISLPLAEDALAELTRRGQLVPHPATDATRYSLPEDGWTYGRVETPTEAPRDESLARLESGDIDGHPLSAPVRAYRGVQA